MTTRPYRYVCRQTGTVKAFKQMTASRAAELNRKLAATGAGGHWVLVVAARPESVTPPPALPKVPPPKGLWRKPWQKPRLPKRSG